MRVGLHTRTPDGEASGPDAVAAVTAAGRLLESLGHVVSDDPVDALDNGYSGGFVAILMTAVARDVARWSARLGRDITSELEPLNQIYAQFGKDFTAVDYFAAIEEMQAWARRLSVWWNDNDILVVPTSPEPPVPLGTIAPTNTDPDVGARMGRLATFTAPFDVTGQPAISLPLHWNADGSADRRATGRRVRTRGRVDPRRVAAGNRAAVGRSPPTGTRITRATATRSAARPRP